MAEQKILFDIRDLVKQFPVGNKRVLTAVNHVSFCVYEGEKFGIVGESGCGKSTLGRVMLQLHTATSGKVIYHGKSTDEISPRYLTDVSLKKLRQDAEKLYQRSLSETDPAKAEKLRAQAHEKLEAGAEFAGSLIISAQLDEAVATLTQAESHMHEAAQMALELNTVSQQIESFMGEETPELPGLQRKAEELSAAIESHYAAAAELWDQVRADENTEYLPITDRCSDPEYRAYLDSLYTTGVDLCRLTGKELRSIRHDIQMIFQDPAASLDPRKTVGNAIEETLKLNTKLSAAARKRRTVNLLQRVGLKPEHYYVYPHNLSGGQKQRVGIARAIANYPSFIVLDEAVSALDVSVKAQILQLLNSLRDERSITYFFITHDLGVAKHFCDRIMVMYLGGICELAPSKELFNNCLHPYTKSLLNSVPRLRFGDDRIVTDILEGEVPSPINPPSGCPFHTRCDRCMEICRSERPVYREVKPNHFVACHLYDEKEN